MLRPSVNNDKQTRATIEYGCVSNVGQMLKLVHVLMTWNKFNLYGIGCMVLRKCGFVNRMIMAISGNLHMCTGDEPFTLFRFVTRRGACGSVCGGV